MGTLAKDCGATMKDKNFLNWLADRLVFHYGESGNTDFVHKLRAIATNTDPENDTKWSNMEEKTDA